MTAAVFVAPGRIELQDRPIPEIGPTDVLLRVNHHDLWNRRPHSEGRVSGCSGPHRRPVLRPGGVLSGLVFTLES
jgi:NADPH:quinone reductase-like Zn-dependent oxidoreductase